MLTFAILNVVVSITLIKLNGADFAIWSCIIGTAVSKLISEWIILPIYDYCVLHLPIKQYYLYILKIVLYSVASYAVAFALRFFFKDYLNTILMFIIEGFAYVIIYSGLVLIFDRKLLLSFVRGKRNEKDLKKLNIHLKNIFVHALTSVDVDGLILSIKRSCNWENVKNSASLLMLLSLKIQKSMTE